MTVFCSTRSRHGLKCAQATSRGAEGSGLVGVEGGADFVDVSAVGADGFVELVAGDVEFFGPVGDVGGHFGVYLLGVVGADGLFFVGGVRLVDFGGVVVLGHAGFLSAVKRDVDGVGGDVLDWAVDIR